MQGWQKTSFAGRRRLRVIIRWSGRRCRRAGIQIRAHAARWMQRHTRLRRRVRWCALVMLSRRRVVEFPLLGPMRLNGVRLWLVCIVLTLGVIIRES